MSRHEDRHGLGFTLVGVLVTIAIIAALAGISRMYYLEIQQEALRTQTHQQLVLLRDRIRAYQTSHPSTAITSLGQVLQDDLPPTDPWGNAIVLDMGSCRLVSYGRDRQPSTTGAEFGDDIVIEVPPNPTPVAREVEPDLASPRIDEVGPIGLVTSRRPVFFARFSDVGTGIDPSSAGIVGAGDGFPEVVESARDGRSLSVTPRTDLPDGRYRLTAVVKDRAGNETSRVWDILVRCGS